MSMANLTLLAGEPFLDVSDDTAADGFFWLCLYSKDTAGCGFVAPLGKAEAGLFFFVGLAERLLWAPSPEDDEEVEDCDDDDEPFELILLALSFRFLLFHLFSIC